MPFKERRALAVSRTCQRPECGTVFHPFRGREATQAYCSRDCSRAAGVHAATGKWPEAVPSTPTVTRTASAITSTDPPIHSATQAALLDIAEWCAIGEHYATLAERALARDSARNGRTLILAGQGSWLGVEHGALVVKQGRTHGAPGVREVLHPALHEVRSIFWLDGVGSLTLAALSWCQSEGVALAVLDASGQPLACTVPDAKGNAALRRAQYLAATTGRDVAIARDLLKRKLLGQQATLVAHRPLLMRANAAATARAEDTLQTALAWLTMETPPPWLQSLPYLRAYEGRCASAYFDCLAAVPLAFPASEVKAGKVPEHWRTLGTRTSPLAPNGNARHAVRPGHAILNLAYGALAADVRRELLAEGLDPACGFLHADKEGRESLVWDMVELQRGAVECLVLSFLTKTTLRTGTFVRESTGALRLHPQLARLVLASSRVRQSATHSDAYSLAEQLTDGVRSSKCTARVMHSST